MIASSIFEWIGSLFTDILFLPFNWVRTEIASADLGWWISNIPNFGFLLILIVLFAYWMKESKKFAKDGTEDRA
jgi:hypothetical protein